MGRRFSFYEIVLRECKGSEDTLKSLPADIPLRKYLEATTGAYTPKYTYRERHGEHKLGIDAFGDGEKYEVAIYESTYKSLFDAAAGYNLPPASFNYATTLTDYYPNAGFKPAIAVISVFKEIGNVPDKKTEASAITGKSYKTNKERRSHTVPFGSDATKKEFEVRKNIVDALDTRFGPSADVLGASVSFRPEDKKKG